MVSMARAVRRGLAILAVLLVLSGLLWPASTLAATTNVQVNVCPEPHIAFLTKPANNTHTTMTSVVLSGKQTTGVSVRITNNGQVYPVSNQALSNLFTDDVPLQLGLNRFTITTSNACNQAQTTRLAVYRTAPPAAAVWQILCIIELLIILLLITLLVLCKRHRRGGEDATPTTL
jgi:hypothetical protein